jgi:hypothetical protein
MANQLLWAKIWFAYSGVVVSRVLPVRIWLHTSNFHKLPIFSLFPYEEGPLHMANQKNMYGLFIAASHCSFLI